MVKKRSLELQAGVVAATVTLSKGSNKVVEKWAKENGKGGQSSILFGSSDMLLMSPEVYDFDRSRNEKNIGRTVNNYHAAILRDLGWDKTPRTFRALSFLRAQRPAYERLSLDQLDELIGHFEKICTEHGVTCRVLLAYGWADLYLYFASEALDPLFAAVVACRAVTFRSRPKVGVFRNAFTIVGVDVERQAQAVLATEPVRPKISMRVEPSELRRLITEDLRQEFPEKDWRITVTSGKRDIFLIPHESVSFRDFWSAHQAWRNKIGLPKSSIYKMETHFDFAPGVVLPEDREVKRSVSCKCESCAKDLEKKFLKAVGRCKAMGPGLARSFDGLARLYREALDDADSCCDFDAAAAHYFGQRRLFDEYQFLYEATKAMEEGSAEAWWLRRRRNVIRDVLDRLEISSVFIFHQEQNGSYADLLSRSERVSLYRGGMQKINSVLLIVMDWLKKRYGLPQSPMLCWWPAGQIKSERPIGVIKVPVYYLHQPEVALFLIIHELGQLTAYEFYRKLGLPPHSRLSPIFKAEDVPIAQEMGMQIVTPDEDHSATLDELGITGPEVKTPGMIWLSARAQRFEVDTGKLITDMWADVFLLRVGFTYDTTGLLNFLFAQLLLLLIVEQETIPSRLRIVPFVARVISIFAVDQRLSRKGETASPFNEDEIKEAALETTRYLQKACVSPRFAKQVADEEKNLPPSASGDRLTLQDVFLDRNVMKKAKDIAQGYSDYVADAMTYMADFRVEPNVAPAGLDDVMDGFLAQIDPLRLPSYFREFVDLGQIGTATTDEERTPREREEHRRLFLARSALVSSILASCDREPRLPLEKNGP